jgi:HEPN domain-containing protein
VVNADKHIAYWKGGAEEDIAAAGSLIEKEHPRHALFFAHLAVEKMLKAHVTKATGDVPPKIHDLLRLAEIAGLSLSDERSRSLAELQDYCLEGRYPERWPEPPSREQVESALSDTREVIEWLASLLK